MERSVCKREDLSQKFTGNKDQAKKQYAHIYKVRSQILKPRLMETAMRKWGIGEEKFVKLSDLKTDEECCIIGTMFKQMELQPSILKEVSDEYKFDSHESEFTHFTSDSDQLILEDSCQRITLSGNVTPGACYTGTVVAVLGRETSAGVFHVDKFTYAGFPPQRSLKHNQSNDEYVLIMSGLKFGDPANSGLEIQILCDYIMGIVGETEDQEFSSQIIHLIIAGNSISEKVLDKANNSNKGGYVAAKAEAVSVNAMEELDFFLSQLLPYISVDIMPGEFDLSGHILPQKPLHPCLFPLSRRYIGTSLRLVSNPYKCEVNGVRFMGTSGQNVNNMASYCKNTENITILKDTLQSQHIAPTAPDTLGCFPYTDTDPFIIDDCPEIYFAANQREFSHVMDEGDDDQKVQLLCVPEFSQTNSVVLVNLKDSTCQELNLFCGFQHDDTCATD